MNHDHRIALGLDRSLPDRRDEVVRRPVGPSATTEADGRDPIEDRFGIELGGHRLRSDRRVDPATGTEYPAGADRKRPRVGGRNRGGVLVVVDGCFGAGRREVAVLERRRGFRGGVGTEVSVYRRPPRRRIQTQRRRRSGRADPPYRHVGRVIYRLDHCRTVGRVGSDPDDGSGFDTGR